MDSSAPVRNDARLPARSVHVADADAVARLGLMFRQLAVALVEEGVRMTLVTDDPGPALETTPLEIRTVPALRGWRAWRLGPILSPLFVPPLRGAHVWSVAGMAAVAECVAGRTPLLVHVSTHAALEWLLQRGAPEGAFVTAACGEYAQRLADRAINGRSSVPVVAPALLAPPVPATPPRRGRALALIWIGRFDTDPGLPALIDAARRLRDRGVDFHLALVGRGRAAERAYREVSRRGVHDRVALVAEPSLWERAMAGMDVCVVPGCQRDICLAPLWAMALGKIVIASRDQVADWFIEDQTCVCFPPGSGEALAQCLYQAATGHPACLAAARGAAAYVRREHLLSSLAAQLLELESAAAAAVPAARPGTQAE